MKTIVLALLVVIAAFGVSGQTTNRQWSGERNSAMTTSDQSFVVVGDAQIEDSLQANPTLMVPTILMEVDSESHGDESLAEVETEIMNPFLLKENSMIEQNHETLASMELLAHQLGAPVYTELEAEKSEHEVEHIEHSLIEHVPHHSNVELFDTLPTSLLEAAPATVATPVQQSAEDTELLDMEHEVAMVELGSAVSARKLDRKNDYAFLDDPKNGGAPTVLKNLKGLDIYVVNTPVADNDNEIRPVQPPHPMSASMREKARLAAIMRAQLVHDIPQPKAQVKPKTKINTLSAYESSLQVSKPLRPLSRLQAHKFDEPLVGGMGAMQLKGIIAKKAAGSARFQQLENGLSSLPVFPKDPTAAPTPIRAYGAGSSFDNRDGPPVLLDDVLPIKAVLVEDLTPDQPPAESKPVGW